jgi:hypothetical protein
VSIWLSPFYTTRSLEGKGLGYVLSDADVETAISTANQLADLLKELQR